MAESRTAAGNGSSEGAVPELPVTRPAESERPNRRYPGSRGTPERERTLKSMREIQFPAAMRGYERTAVDRYVTEVNRVIAELEISSSPEAAVRHALDEVSEETRELLQRAHTTAEEITARSRSKADDRVQQAEAEAQELRVAAAREVAELRESAQRELAELREATNHEMAELREATSREAQQLRASAQREADEVRSSARQESDEMREAAETRTRELARSAEKIWRERRRLLEDMRGVADQLVAIGETEASRFVRFDPEGTGASVASDEVAPD
jgi:cell division septum initiation protein DivIVA